MPTVVAVVAAAQPAVQPELPAEPQELLPELDHLLLQLHFLHDQYSELQLLHLLLLMHLDQQKRFLQ